MEEIEGHIINVVGMIKLENPHLATIIEIIHLGKKQQLKLVGENRMRDGILCNSTISPPKH